MRTYSMTPDDMAQKAGNLHAFVEFAKEALEEKRHARALDLLTRAENYAKACYDMPSDEAARKYLWRV